MQASLSCVAKGANKAVVEQFGLRHSPLLLGLAKNTERLDMVHALTRPRHPLAVAMLAPFPWRGLGVATYIVRAAAGHVTPGFAQVLKRPDRPESDILALAPDLAHSGPPADATWSQLLLRLTHDAGYHGVQRIFVSAPADGREVELLRHVGFAPYTQETIYRWEPSNALAPVANGDVRPQRPGDAWALQRLYHAATPPLVQQAEGSAESESSGLAPAWWESGLQAQGVVVYRAGNLASAVQMVSGPAGHWLRLWSAGEEPGGVNLLLEHCLAQLAAERQRRPVYLALRDYQGGLQTLLREFDFRPYLRRTRLVKHLVVRVKEAEPALMPAPSLVRGALPMLANDEKR